MSFAPFEKHSSSNSKLKTRHRDAILHLLSIHQLRETLALNQHPSLRNSFLAGVQAALTGVIALPLVYLSPWSDLIGFAGLGTLVALFGRFSNRSQRNWILLQAGICQTLSVFTVSFVAWLGASEFLQLSFLTVLCGVLLFISITRKLGIPGPLIFVFGAGAAVTSNITLDEVIQRTLMLAVVSGLAWFICAVTHVLNARRRKSVLFLPKLCARSVIGLLPQPE